MTKPQAHVERLEAYEINEIIPQLSQHQGSLTSQLASLRQAGVRLGLYDAVDWMDSTVPSAEKDA